MTTKPRACAIALVCVFAVVSCDPDNPSPSTPAGSASANSDSPTATMPGASPPSDNGPLGEVERGVLRHASNWKVRSQGLRHVYSFAPPRGSAELTTRVGRHLNCRDYPLSSTSAELAQFPHVGTMLMYGADSCLQSWNLTLVFDPNEKPTTVIAAVYDQWEW
jgi:hypothetical protein